MSYAIQDGTFCIAMLLVVRFNVLYRNADVHRFHHGFRMQMRMMLNRHVNTYSVGYEIQIKNINDEDEKDSSSAYSLGMVWNRKCIESTHKHGDDEKRGKNLSKVKNSSYILQIGSVLFRVVPTRCLAVLAADRGSYGQFLKPTDL
uniref:Uncharacterized protein n=1 Tax=Anopheles culicifacies TaxID=139723 RepID=A0A182MF43_9DIPT